MIALYYANVRSLMIYASIIWSSYHTYQAKRLVTIHHKFLRMLSIKCSVKLFHRYQEALFLLKLIRGSIDSKHRGH